MCIKNMYHDVPARDCIVFVCSMSRAALGQTPGLYLYPSLSLAVISTIETCLRLGQCCASALSALSFAMAAATH